MSAKKPFEIFFCYLLRACDGCLDFNGMFNEQKQWFNSDHIYKFPRPTTTDNFLLGTAAITLEKIYKSIDWPFTAPFNPDLTKSLYQSGKSRADLWQFAGMVALERTIERANRACDLDFHIRQQVKYIYRPSINAAPHLGSERVKNWQFGMIFKA